MPFREVDLSDFPGLDLRDEAGMLGAADLMDVRWTSDGSLTSRHGSEAWSVTPFAAFSTAFAADIAGFRYLVLSRAAAGNGTYQVLSATGTSLFTYASGVIGSTIIDAAAKFSTPTEEAVIMVGQSNTDNDWFKFTPAAGIVNGIGTSFQRMNALTGILTAVSDPWAGAVGAWSGQERLVWAPGARAISNPWNALAMDSSMVWFSEPAQPHIYKDSSFVRLGVGDGDFVTLLAGWRDLLFAFKKHRFWVFTGSSVAGDGTVRFQRRAIEAGVGCLGPYCAAVASDGVYFVADRGVYRTTGGEPECISDPISPMFGASPLPPFYTGPVIDPSRLPDSRLEWVYDSIYFSFQALVGTNVWATLVYHIPTKRWSVWSLPTWYVFAFNSRGVDEPHFLFPSNSTITPVARVKPGLAGDATNAAAMAPFYLGPYRRLAKDRVVRVRQLKVWGAGSLDAGMAVDFERTVRSESQVLTAGLPGTAREAKAYRANQFRGSYAAVYLGFTPPNKAGEKQWAAQRVVADVAGGKPSVQADSDGG